MSEIPEMHALLEHIDGQYRAIMESLSKLDSIDERLNRVEIKIDRIDLRLQIVETVVKEHHVALKQNGILT